MTMARDEDYLKTIHDYQVEHLNWVEKNFPDQKPYQPLLGLAEEVGELSHAFLKREQGCRGTAEEHDKEIKDAVGDIFVFLA
jgi:NTP pyrophosphatase (non-canonical NTP hydrolase)